MTLKRDDWNSELSAPPESIRFRFLELMERLTIDWRTVVQLGRHERRYRREIIRWIMGDPHGGRAAARRSLPAGYVVHAWCAPKDEGVIVLMRTQ